MATIPWRVLRQTDPHGRYIVVATRATLGRYRSIPGFGRATRCVVRQLRRAPGALGFSLQANFRTRTFSTVSAWTDEASLAAFRDHPAHREAALAFDGAYAGRMAWWTAKGETLPPARKDVARRLDESPVLMEVSR